MSAENAAAAREGLALFALCWLLAKVEIEIEGDQGWAASLPTWRWEPEWFLNLSNGKAVTGYHLWLSLFLVGMFHLPLVYAGFTRELWAKCLSSYLLTTAVWDLQWFAWNPAWGLAKFRSTPVPWFRRKLLGFPVDYYVAVALSGASVWLIWSPGTTQWLIRTGTAAAASALSVLAAAWKRPRDASRA